MLCLFIYYFSVINRDVCLLKIDVEGMEPFVVNSSIPLMQMHAGRTIARLISHFYSFLFRSFPFDIDIPCDFFRSSVLNVMISSSKLRLFYPCLCSKA